jgi:geranylgeranyl diphosphate synthase type II
MSSSLEAQVGAALDKLEAELEKLVLPPAIRAPMLFALQKPAKRFRPLLLLLAYQNISQAQSLELALPAAVAIELFHNFTLVHDDIMDNAPLRRGRPSLHVAWGSNTAILAGDALLAVCFEQLCNLKCSSFQLIGSIFSKMALGVCEGQMLDMQLANQRDCQLDQYLEMIRLKTAILMGTSLQIGVLLATSNLDLASALYRYGEAMGIAFQLQDDLLDLYAAQSGKQKGGDIIEDKNTYLWIKAFAIASPEERAALLQTRKLSDPQEKINAAQILFDKLNIKEVAQIEIQAYLQKAQQALYFGPTQYLPALEQIHSFVAALFNQQAALLC